MPNLWLLSLAVCYVLASPLDQQTVLKGIDWRADVEVTGDSALGWYDPRERGGRFLDYTIDDLGEPMNVIISGRSDPYVLTDKGFEHYTKSLGYSQECLGLHYGNRHYADLGDGDMQKIELVLARQHYFPVWGTCWESLAGGHHFRAWRQNGTDANSGAWFIGASKELDSSKHHTIVPNGWNLGRDWFVESAVGGTHHRNHWWKADVEWRTDLLEEGSDGINHGIAQDGRIAVLTPQDPVVMESDTTRQILPEILGEIFTWALTWDEGMDQEKREILVQLMLVCKWWREAALCSNRLWANVLLDSITDTPVPSQKLNVWFGRAGVCHKTLVTRGWGGITKPCPRHPENVEAIEGACKLHHLLTYLSVGPPLYRLCIVGHTRVCLNWLMHELQISGSPSWLSIHDYTRLTIGGGYWDAPLSPILVVFPPSLSSLTLEVWVSSDDCMRTFAEIAPTTLKTLKSLVIRCRLDLSPLVTLLRFCTNLQHLAISQDGGECGVDMDAVQSDQRVLLSQEPITFPHLTSLDLGLQPPRDVHSLLRLLRSPNLETIRTRHERTTEPEERYLWNSLHSLHLLTPNPDRPPVRHLTLYARSIPPATVPTQELLEIFSDLPPSVQHLTLENLTFNVGEFLELHGVQRNSTNADISLNLLPVLQTFEMIDPGFDFDLAGFLQYVKGRVGNPPAGVSNSHRLRKIVFKFSAHGIWYSMGKEFLQQYRDDDTLQGLETSFGVVMDLFIIP